MVEGGLCNCHINLMLIGNSFNILVQYIYENFIEEKLMLL